MPRVLIIATIPYTTNDVSRTLDSYFHFWRHEDVAQIFSRNETPCKGHCEQLYQITDADLLKCWLKKKNTTGRVYHYDELPEMGSKASDDNNSDFKGAYKIGRMHTPSIELLRRILWRKKYWCTEKLNQWLDEFKPEVIVYNYSNHLFTQQIALYVAQKYSIPIITTIADDYYFNDEKSFSLSYKLYRRMFKRLSERIFSWKGSAVYCSDKIRDKYNARFDLKGETVYYSSQIQRRGFRIIDTARPRFVYCGSIRLGRNLALLEIAEALQRINTDYHIEVYSNEKDIEYYGMLENHPGIKYGGAIPYSEVQEISMSCDVLVVAEGFREEDLNFTRYSLSTKVADSLSSGPAIFVYGPSEAGAIEYLKQTRAAQICSDKDSLIDSLRELIFNADLQRLNYEQAVNAANMNHTVESCCEAFRKVLKRTLEKR